MLGSPLVQLQSGPITPTFYAALQSGLYRIDMESGAEELLVDS